MEIKKIIKVRTGKSKNGETPIKIIEIDFNSLGGVNFTPIQGGEGCIFTPTKERYNNNNKKGVSKVTKKNIFFSLSDEQKKTYIDKFIKEILTKERNLIINPAAYEQKIREKFTKRNKAQLESFENWYLETECLRLLEKYQEMLIEVKEFGTCKIESIYPYFETVGFKEGDNVKNKIFVSLEEILSHDKNTKGFNTVEELEDFVIKGLKDFENFINPQ